MTAPQSILVVVTRRIGDVFLSGALVRSLRRSWPAARIDMLVFAGTEGIVHTHPDVADAIAFPSRASWRENVAFAKRIWRSYDIAISTSPSDRPTLYAWMAGRRRVGIAAPGAKHAWKTGLLDRTVPFDDLNTHTVLQNLMLAHALGIPPVYELPVSWPKEEERKLVAIYPGFASTRYAIVHPFPKFRYKMWNDNAWRELALWLRGHGLEVLVTGGPGEDEKAYIESLLSKFCADVIDLSGKLNFSQLAALLSKAAIYVGPDTVTTHLAAALGVPTVALFGPSNPVKWGPWPRGWSEGPSPYSMRGTQLRGNVALVQGEGHCVPCRQEGCARAIESESACLQMLGVQKVLEMIETLWNP